MLSEGLGSILSELAKLLAIINITMAFLMTDQVSHLNNLFRGVIIKNNMSFINKGYLT